MSNFLAWARMTWAQLVNIIMNLNRPPDDGCAEERQAEIERAQARLEMLKERVAPLRSSVSVIERK